MRLILIRHGRAAPATDAAADFARPLSPSGKQEVAAVADRLAASDWAPQLLVASAAPRAFETAAILARRLGGVQLATEDALYLAGHEALLQAVARHGVGRESIALVAHNPGLTMLIRELAGVRLDDLPPAGIAGIAFSGDSWHGLADGHLQYFDAPVLPR